MKVFRSKVSMLLVGIILLAFLFPIYLSFENLSTLDTKSIVILISQILVPLVMCYFIFETKYIIKENTLHIKLGFISYGKIAIESITKIEKTNSLLAAPAASLDRILIRYGKHRSIILSPKLKQEFIAALLKINPEISSK